jgi:hypothetical protein
VHFPVLCRQALSPDRSQLSEQLVVSAASNCRAWQEVATLRCAVQEKPIAIEELTGADSLATNLASTNDGNQSPERTQPNTFAEDDADSNDESAIAFTQPTHLKYVGWVGWGSERVGVVGVVEVVGGPLGSASLG